MRSTDGLEWGDRIKSREVVMKLVIADSSHANRSLSVYFQTYSDFPESLNEA